MDYSKLTEITVKTQAELDAIPDDFKGHIYISGGTPFERICIKKQYYFRVVARDNSSVEARDNSSVVAWNNSSVVAWNNSSVVAWDNSSVVAWDNSSVEAWDNSSVEARDNSSVVARNNSSVEARDNSSVVARDNSSVVAWGNSQIVDMLQVSKVKISANARIVYMPKNILEFMDFYRIKHTKTKATFYKAVNKYPDGTYHSNYDKEFKYEIGKLISEECDRDISEECGKGLHISHLDWALNFGCKWDNLAILEVETNISDIVLPNNSTGKVRTSKLKVIREVPLEECGLYGKILATRRQQREKKK